MRDIEGAAQLADDLRDVLSDKAKMAGCLSAISKYLSEAGIPKAGSAQQRVKLLAILYEEERQKNRRLELLLKMNGEQADEK